MRPNHNRYYTIAFAGAAITLLLQVILAFTAGPYVGVALAPFYPVWVIMLVVGWRKAHPRR